MYKKHYIFLTGTIYDVGGAQIYLRNKSKYLRENGWIVYIFSYRYGNRIVISELQNYHNQIIRELKYFPVVFSEKNVNETKKKIVEKLEITKNERENDTLIIESHQVSTSLWGEIIAQRLKCKHISYLLYEVYAKQSNHILKYLDFKHSRKELYGITKKSLDILFDGYKQIEESKKYFFSAKISNVVTNDTNEFVENLQRSDFNIGCLSRLDKPFILTLIDEVVLFAKKNSNKNFLLVIVGDGYNRKAIKKIHTKTKYSENITLKMPGAMYPIPKKFFLLMDIFFGVAGAAYICAQNGGLTVTVDVNSHKPIGYLGYDTLNTIYKQGGSRYDRIFNVLEDIFIRKNKPDINNFKREFFDASFTDYRKEYDRHMKLIASSTQKKEYYPINFDISAQGELQFIKIMVKLLGMIFVNRLHKLYYKLTILWKRLYV